MKLSEGIKLKGRPAKIPDCTRDKLPAFFVEMGFKVGVEIGVYRGEFTEKFCKAGLMMFAVDPWIGYSGAGRSEQKQEMQDTNYEFAKQRLALYPNCTLIRKTSMEALGDFVQESLDFVYIDGNHRFRYIAEDISEWFTKVKIGGVISGHDFFCTNPQTNNLICQVKPVVDAFIDAYQIQNFYTFGTGRSLNWMFIKP